jgi:hypothetical protein
MRMTWTTDMKVRALLALPWSIVREDDPDDGPVLRVKELPSVIATGATDEALERDFWASLQATLQSYLHFGDPIPLPPGAKGLPWELPLTRHQSVHQTKLGGDAWTTSAAPVVATHGP